MTKSAVYSIVLKVMHQSCKNHKKGDITQHHVDMVGNTFFMILQFLMRNLVNNTVEKLLFIIYRLCLYVLPVFFLI